VPSPHSPCYPSSFSFSLSLLDVGVDFYLTELKRLLLFLFPLISTFTREAEAVSSPRGNPIVQNDNDDVERNGGVSKVESLICSDRLESINFLGGKEVRIEEEREGEESGKRGDKKTRTGHFF